MKKFVFITVLLLFFISPVEAALFTVCSSGCDSTTVQGGINLASNFDEVRIIDTREYQESVVVNKSIKLTSNSSIKPLIWNDGGSPVINITSNNSIVEKLEIKYNGSTFFNGKVRLFFVNNVTLFSINITHDNFGGSSGTTVNIDSNYSLIDSINITSNARASILSISSVSENNTVTNIKTMFTYEEGDIGFDGKNNTITNNNFTVTGNETEIFLYSSTLFKNNAVKTTGSGSDGLIIFGSNINISNNTIDASNSAIGILFPNFGNADNNYISLNNITANGNGIRIDSTNDNNFFISNTIKTTGTNNFGFVISSSNNTSIINNIINATGDDLRLSGSGTTFVLNTSFNRSQINFSSISDTATVFIQHYFDFVAQDLVGNAIYQANVIGLDNRLYSSINPTASFSVFTDVSGSISRQTLTEFLANATFNSTSGYLLFSNYNISATKSLAGKWQSLNLTDNSLLVLSLDLSQGPTPPPPINIQPPPDPTVFPPTEIPPPPPETTFDLPSTGITIRLDPKLVLTLYPLTRKKATIHNISEIEPSRYKILLCNQTEIASYEINITSDLAYFCANYSGFSVEDPTVSIFRFVQSDWSLLSADKVIKNSSNKIVCGQITSTPYLVAGFQSNPDSKTALQSIKETNNTIELARRQNISTEEAEGLLSQAVDSYYSCNYITASTLANQALNSLVTLPSVPIYVPAAIGVIITIAVAWYLLLRHKVRVKIKS